MWLKEQGVSRKHEKKRVHFPKPTTWVSLRIQPESMIYIVKRRDIGAIGWNMTFYENFSQISFFFEVNKRENRDEGFT